MKSVIVLLAICTLGLTSGCVTGRRTLTLDVPPSSATTATKGKVYIASVTDDREFQNKPSDPSIPSIDGDIANLSPAQKDRMIGRQRNTWGHAMGDIDLPANDSVTKRVRLLVAEGLRRGGYEVVTDPAGAIPVTVSVDKFWAWTTPGMWALTFEVKIFCKVTIDTPPKPTKLAVLAYGKNHGQVAKDGNWREAFEPAFDEFLVSFKYELEKADLH